MKCMMHVHLGNNEGNEITKKIFFKWTIKKKNEMKWTCKQFYYYYQNWWLVLDAVKLWLWALIQCPWVILSCQYVHLMWIFVVVMGHQFFYKLGIRPYKVPYTYRGLFYLTPSQEIFQPFLTITYTFDNRKSFVKCWLCVAAACPIWSVAFAEMPQPPSCTWCD